MNKTLCPICFSLLEEPNESHDCDVDKTGYCGCGDPQLPLLFLKSMLEDVKRGNLSKKYDDIHGGLFWHLMYYLDDKGFTEHGSSAGSCWLSEKGKITLKLLQENLNDE